MFGTVSMVPASSSACLPSDVIDDDMAVQLMAAAHVQDWPNLAWPSKQQWLGMLNVLLQQHSKHSMQLCH